MTTHMGDADPTVDGESSSQVLIKPVKPGTIRLIHQLSNTNNICTQWVRARERESVL